MSDGHIALITDFGSRDGFTGIMKGVMYAIAPQARIVDIAHDIPPQAVRHASWVLDQAFKVFPAGAMFLGVVDPGVGNPRQRKLLAYSPRLEKAFVGPDNGLITRILHQDAAWQCRSIENSRYFRDAWAPSQTFHGRDIYAPVAAHWLQAYQSKAMATFLSDIGPVLPVDQLCRLPLMPPSQNDHGEIAGEVDVIDTYGNLITTIPSSWLNENPVSYLLQVKAQHWSARYQQYYTQVAPEETDLIIVPGSHGMLEVAVPGGNAAALLNIIEGTSIRLSPASRV